MTPPPSPDFVAEGGGILNHQNIIPIWKYAPVGTGTGCVLHHRGVWQ